MCATENLVLRLSKVILNSAKTISQKNIIILQVLINTLFQMSPKILKI